MNQQALREVLEKLQSGAIDADDAAHAVAALRSEPLGFATVDHDRHARCGHAEVIYAAGKTPEQVAAIAQSILKHAPSVLITRMTAAHADPLHGLFSNLPVKHSAAPGTMLIGTPQPLTDAITAPIPIVTAGTSDESVAEEAALTCEAHGQVPRRISDVGVAGIHRLFERLPELRGANVVVCIAGMEGALPSVVSGLLDVPVIAVPTSVGYGAAFGGVAALLGMLTSCASGVTVVNIDNGFGAANVACMINRQVLRAKAQPQEAADVVDNRSTRTA